MTKQKKWVAIAYSLPKGKRSSAYKKLFGFKWTERKPVRQRRLQLEKQTVQTGSGRAAETVLVTRIRHPARLTHREYRREIPSDLKGLQYSRLGRGVILVPPTKVDKAVGILKSRGCAVTVAGPVIPSQEQYQASNAYVLGQWQSYLSALDGLLPTPANDNQAKMSLSAAVRLSERFAEDVRRLPVASVPEDVEALSMKSKIAEVLDAYSSGSKDKASLLSGLQMDVRAQLKVMREQGQAVLAALV